MIARWDIDGSLLAAEDLLKRFRKAHPDGGSGGTGYGCGRGFCLFLFRQVSEQGDAGRRRGEEDSLLLIADNIDGLTLAERSDFEHVEPGRPALSEREPLAVAEEPDATEKKADDQNQRAEDAKNGSAGVGQCAGNGQGVGSGEDRAWGRSIGGNDDLVLGRNVGGRDRLALGRGVEDGGKQKNEKRGQERRARRFDEICAGN